MMAKQKQTSVYVNDVQRDWLGKYSIEGTLGGNVNFIFDWAMSALMTGAKTAFVQFDNDELEVIIASLFNFTPDVRIKNIVNRTRDWFNFDEGIVLLEWKSNERREKLYSKLAALSPTETMALIFWARGYWEHEGKDITLEAYCETFPV